MLLKIKKEKHKVGVC